jgi:hypothetical protein
MSNVTISQLNAATTLGGTEPVPCVQSGNTVKATMAQIAAYVLANPVATGTVTASNIITTSGTPNLTITPYGTGAIYLNSTSNVGVQSSTTTLGTGAATATLTTNGTFNLVLRTNAAVANQGSITINNGANGNIALAPDGTGVVTSSKSVNVTGSVTATAAITSSGINGIGYTAGAGGAVTQATSKSTGVTLNKASGEITMNNAALNAATAVSFTLTNSVIASTDGVIVNIKNGATLGSYAVGIDSVSAGACVITLHNYSANPLSEAVVLNFVVIKAANS